MTVCVVRDSWFDARPWSRVRVRITAWIIFVRRTMNPSEQYFRGCNNSQLYSVHVSCGSIDGDTEALFYIQPICHICDGFAWLRVLMYMPFLDHKFPCSLQHCFAAFPTVFTSMSVQLIPIHPITSASEGTQTHPRLTPYRIAFILTTAGLGTIKAVLVSKNDTISSTTVEWITGVVVALM